MLLNEIRTIDPRIKLTLLPLVSCTGFFVSDTILLFIIVLFLFLLYLYSRMYKKASAFLLFFSSLSFLEFGLERMGEHSLVFALYMMLFFVSRMTLLAMIGVYITGTTSVSQTLEALNRMRIPRSISIPFGVLLRFMPTMKNEMRALKESMRIRGVVKSGNCIFLHPVRYAEYTLVPLLMRMLRVSDELSASALIRGLDSEEKRVRVVGLQCGPADVIVTALGILAVAGVVIMQIYIKGADLWKTN